MFCTRKAFVATGGFDEKLFGAEDVAMCWALVADPKLLRWRIQMRGGQLWSAQNVIYSPAKSLRVRRVIKPPIVDRPGSSQILVRLSMLGFRAENSCVLRESLSTG
jgi:hypothetical protein